MSLTEYKQVFLEELEEQLELIDDCILKLEQDGKTDRVIQNLFRAAHTLKGSSATMGFESMKELTHEMEHLLDLVRHDRMEVSIGLINLLFKSLDLLKELKKEIESTDQTMSNILPLLAELQAFAAEKTNEHVVQDTKKTKHALSLYMETKIEEAQEKGAIVSWVRVTISKDSLIKGARAHVVFKNLHDWGEVLFADPSPDMIEEGKNESLEISYVFSGNQTADEIKNYVNSMIDVVGVEVDFLQRKSSLEEDIVPAPVIAAELSPEKSNETHGNKNQTIRVSVERLEDLMNLVGELVIDQTRISQVERNLLRQSASFSESMEELGQISDHLSRVISELQGSVMKARMLPIEQLFNRFPRMVRDLALKLNKDVELVIEGKDTELDRTLIEEIADPLIHLIRNALDHGIESAADRIAKGKSPKGTIKIRAAHEDNQVIIYVEDDGAGIDASKILQSAIQKGLLAEADAGTCTEKEAIHFIFHSGFSTASSVSDVSGRGVGMDIVKSHIEKLNGLIDIHTEIGKGTQFKIRLPLTLAIITGLLVKLNEQTFIIPMSNIAEIIRVTPQEIQSMRGESVIVLRNQIIPIVWLHEQFQIEKKLSNGNHTQLVIVGTAEKRIALAVDELLGNQEVVIKSLGSYIGKVDCLSGATILGNGKVALILEISAVIKKLIGK
ncbi:chemotaxis protein CheA [Paenibacillus sp. Soil766]|uniref:chemotaxis protein CheA n=1 Tax=Paenibacillus sp. Soil766 TaxID=1736404 RepID=UPI0007C784C2|nr:chemotaxis protein CheA [Paenibacillus sp. Soil766]